MTEMPVTLDHSTAAWSIVEAQLDAFCKGWDEAPPHPRIEDYVGDFNPVFRRLILVDLIKLDLEYRWNDPALVKPIETYFDAWPELVGDGEVPPELLYEEIHQRRQHGESVVINDYLNRYPKSAEALQRLAGIEAAGVSTALNQGRVPKEFKVGETVDDFDLRVELGRGAFATVFLAVQRSLQRMVALKLSANRGTEAQVLSQLDHPNIVRVYDRRVVKEDDLQLFYMQYVRGGSLYEALEYVRSHPRSAWSGQLLLQAIDKTLDDHGEVPAAATAARETLAQSSWTKVVCDMGSQIASALDYAHRMGVLHRDIKPANILLCDDGVAKLADFNISCCSKLDGASPAAYFGGSLAYMSPEQLEAYNPLHPRQPESLDGRSDIYATGVLIWELLTGSRPFPNEKLAAKWEATLADMTERRRQGLASADWDRLPETCPPSLRTFFRRCLDPTPNNRFHAAGEMIRLLRIAGCNSAQGIVLGQARLIQFARRMPYLAMLPACVISNVLAACFVYTYNNDTNLQSKQPAFDLLPWLAGESAMYQIQSAVNPLLFSVGIGLMFLFTWPLARGLRDQHTEQVTDASLQSKARVRSLNLGLFTLFLGGQLWCLSAFVFPVGLWLLGVELTTRETLNFVGSNALGGLIAGTYSYFLVTALGISAWYPTFLVTGTDDAGEVALLERTARRSTVVEMLAASLPMLAIVLLVTWAWQDTGDNDLMKTSLGVLSIASLVGFGFLFWLSRRIRSQIEALINVLKPNQSPGSHITVSSS